MSLPGFLSALRSVRKAESLDARQILDLQEIRFRKLLKHAFRKSKFYQGFYRQHGITERDLDTVVPEDLPVIDKNVMMEHYDEFVTDPVLRQSELEQFINEFPSPASKYRKGYSVVHTSGSSGTVGLFVYGPHEWTHSKALALRATGIRHPIWRRKRIAFIAATEGHFASVATFYNLPRFLFKRLPLSISSPIEGICSQINRFKPDVITGYASGLNLLAEEQLAGRIKIAPKEAYCTGDPLTATFRQRVEKAFGVNPVNMYGSSETMTLAGECREHHRLHLFNDWFSVQVVDENMKPASSGRVVVTNLYNYTQPLIRYQMNDEIVLSDKPCPCGWPFPVIGNLAGRHEEFLWFDQGQGKKDFIHPIVLAEFFVPGLEKFQFVQTSPNSLLMKVVVQGEPNDVVTAIRKKMDEILAGKSLEGSVRFEVEVVEGMRNNPKTGKFRLIIPFPSP
jgi:putative adenylate-forming enzyme